MTLSVVVICWNSLQRLQRLFPTLMEATATIDNEIILVDNGSTDGTATWITAQYPAVRYRPLKRNHGVAYARNRGIEMARGQYIWLLDDDTEVNPQALSTMLAHMQADPKCGVCACRLLDAEGNLQESFKPFPGLGVKIRNLLGLKHASPYTALLQSGQIFHPTYVIGACQLIRRQALEIAGPLDQKIFYGPEDADFCIRVAKAGFTVDYLPQVAILHHWRRLTTSSPLSPIGRAHIRGLIHFWLRHRRLF